MTAEFDQISPTRGDAILVLTRKGGQRIWIGEDICIEIITIRRGGTDAVKVGIIAPRDVPVHREELILNSMSNYQKEVVNAAKSRLPKKTE